MIPNSSSFKDCYKAWLYIDRSLEKTSEAQAAMADLLATVGVAFTLLIGISFATGYANPWLSLVLNVSS